MNKLIKVGMIMLSCIPLGSMAMTTDIKTGGFLENTFPQEHCLALNIYYEARGSNFADKAAVADVVFNRVKDPRWPNTICEVVQDGYVKGRKDCQFSWYCDGKADIPKDKDAWLEAMSIAWSMSKWGKFIGISGGATNYHATYVNPSWAKKIEYLGQIGAHKFYKE